MNVFVHSGFNFSLLLFFFSPLLVTLLKLKVWKGNAVINTLFATNGARAIAEGDKIYRIDHKSL